MTSVNKPHLVAGILEDHGRGLEIVRKKKKTVGREARVREQL